MPLLKDNFLYESVPETVTKPVVAFRALLEFLHECSHKCKGCFVNRQDANWTENDLDILHDIMGKVTAQGILFDELVLGPVDCLSASNTFELLRHKRFIEIMTEYKPILALPTTMQCDDAKLLELIAIFNEHYTDKLELEFQIVIHPDKLIAGNIGYIENLKRKIQLLDTLKQPVCYALQMNVRNLSGYDLPSLTQLIEREFHTILDINPSFFRSNDKRVIEGMLAMWNATLASQVTDTNKHYATAVIADQSHSWFNYVGWTFAGGSLYGCPFLLENVATLAEQFRVPKTGNYYNASDLLAYIEHSWAQQFAYAAKTSECASCEFLNSCTARQVLKYMQMHDWRACPVPKSMMQLYSQGIGNSSENLYDWSGYTIADEIATGNWRNHSVSRKKSDSSN